MSTIKKTFSVRETSKLIKFPGGEIKFYKWLRENGFLCHDNEPYQLYRDKEWFEVILTNKHKVNPHFPKMVTRVTFKGVLALEKLMKKHFPICKPCEDARS